jgi:hypothetical protein
MQHRKNPVAPEEGAVAGGGWTVRCDIAAGGAGVDEMMKSVKPDE